MSLEDICRGKGSRYTSAGIQSGVYGSRQHPCQALLSATQGCFSASLYCTTTVAESTMGEISSHPTWRNELSFSRAKRQNANILPVLQQLLQFPTQVTPGLLSALSLPNASSLVPQNPASFINLNRMERRYFVTLKLYQQNIQNCNPYRKVISYKPTSL